MKEEGLTDSKTESLPPLFAWQATSREHTIKVSMVSALRCVIRQCITFKIVNVFL